MLVLYNIKQMFKDLYLLCRKIDNIKNITITYLNIIR